MTTKKELEARIKELEGLIPEIGTAHEAFHEAEGILMDDKKVPRKTLGEKLDGKFSKRNKVRFCGHCGRTYEETEVKTEN